MRRAKKVIKQQTRNNQMKNNNIRRPQYQQRPLKSFITSLEGFDSRQGDVLYMINKPLQEPCAILLAPSVVSRRWGQRDRASTQCSHIEIAGGNLPVRGNGREKKRGIDEDTPFLLVFGHYGNLCAQYVMNARSRGRRMRPFVPPRESSCSLRLTFALYPPLSLWPVS